MLTRTEAGKGSRGGKSWWRENRSIDPWLDTFSLDFSPVLIVFPADCSLKRPTLPKVLPTLKETHRQVGAVEPRPQALDSNAGEGLSPPPFTVLPLLSYVCPVLVLL